MSAATVSRKNPFVGPRSFQEGEPLYGRSRETVELANLLIAERIVLLYSPSGAGKTSLIQAALLPKLKARRFAALPVVRVNVNPPPELAGVEGFNRYAFSVLSSLEKRLEEADQLPDGELAQLSLRQYLDQRQALFTGGAEKQAAILVFDQFEEILTSDASDLAHKQAFFAQLGAALEDPNRFALFSMREDYIAGLDPYLLAVPTHFRSTFRLELLSQQTARQVLQQTSLQEGVTFTDEAADQLITDLSRVRAVKIDGSIDDIAGASVESVQMQVVCFNLWEKLDPGVESITLAEIEAIGDVDQALGDYYSTKVAAVAQEQNLPERTLRRWFDQVLITPSGIRNQVLLEQDASQGLDNETIYRLEDAHLVRLESGRNRTWVELAHDRLVAPVRGSNAAWFEANLSVLQRQAEIWEQEKRPPDLLLRDTALETAEAEAAAGQGEFTESENEFLEQSKAARQRELEEQAAQQRELEEQIRTSKMLRRRLWYAAIALGLAVIAVLIAFSFWQSVNTTNTALATEKANAIAEAERASTAEANAKAEAERAITAEAHAETEATRALAAEAASKAEALRAQIGELSGQVLILLESQPDKAMLLGVEAIREAARLEQPNLLARQASYSAWRYNPHLLQIFQGHTSVVWSVAFSPDGATLASGSDDGTVRLWDAASGQPLGELLSGDFVYVYSVAFSPDGATLASGSDDGTVRLWDAASGQPLGELLSGDSGLVFSVAFSPDGATLASGSSDGTIQLWDAASGQPLGEPLVGHSDWVRSVAFSPDGATLASGSDDGTVRLWDAASGQPLGEPLVGHSGYVLTVAFSPDGKTLASGSDDGTIRLWDAVRGQPLGEPLSGHSGGARSVAFSPDGTTLASGSDDGTVRLWDAASGQPEGEPLSGHSGGARSVAFSPDGRTLASGSDDGIVWLWVVESGQPLGEPLSGHSGGARSVAFSPDGATLASGSGDGSIRLWDLENRQLLGEPLVGHSDSVRSVAFSPDRATLASGSEDGTIRLWDAASGQPLGEPLVGDSGAVLSVAFSPDGATLASGSQEGTIRLWNATSGQPLGEPLSGHSDSVRSVAFSPDGGTLASGSQDGTIRLWDVASGQPLGEPFVGHYGWVFSVAFSPDGSTLASGSDDGTVRQWDAASGQPLGEPLIGHTDWVRSVAFSPDGATLASGSDEGTVRLWDATTGQPLGEPLSGDFDTVWSVAFSPDGKTLASGSSDGTVRLWDSDPQLWSESLCRKVGRNLTREEWNQYLSWIGPYQPTCPQWPWPWPAGE